MSEITFNVVERAAIESFENKLLPLRSYLKESDRITEIMINRFDDIWVYGHGINEKLSIQLPESSVTSAIKTLAASIGIGSRGADSSSIINVGREDIRIAAVLRPTSIHGDALCIRKHQTKEFTLRSLRDSGLFTRADKSLNRLDEPDPQAGGEAMEQFLLWCIQNKKTIGVCGVTGSGKTAMLNALLGAMPLDRRVITVEDTQELKNAAPNKVAFLSNEQKGITANLLLQTCLRFKPDSIVFGEVRSGVAYDLLQALMTHTGGLFTLHATSTDLGFSRLRSLVSEGIPAGSQKSDNDINRLIADSVDYIFHIQHENGNRHVTSVMAIDGFDNTLLARKIYQQ
jgi:pilus assembly protein CpaF